LLHRFTQQSASPHGGLFKFAVASDYFKTIEFIYASDVLNKFLSASVVFASWFQKFIISVATASESEL
jgi:hypothetical protein